MNQKEVKMHTMEKDMGLPGIFGIEALELLTKKLSEATDFSFNVIDYRGNSLTDGIICNRFCEYHKDSRECAECQVTEAIAAAKSAIKCCPYLFSCPRGLFSIAVPIIVNDQYLGALVGGRIRCTDASEKEEADPGHAEEEYLSIPLFSQSKMMAIGDLMFFMLREIGEKETMGLKLLSASREESQLEDMKRWNDSLREELKKSELQRLRSHLHPQFLLNMFGTVANFAILEDAVQTEELIVDLSSLLRYYIDESVEFTTIEAEMKQIENYLSILRSKYESKFHYHIKMSENAKQVRFPVLILFPLLGYVLNYGAFPASFKGILFIDIDLTGDQCKVSMQLENQARSSLMGNRSPGRIMDEEIIQIQLSDTRKRLNVLYGDKCILEMKPNLVTLRFPSTINKPPYHE